MFQELVHYGIHLLVPGLIAWLFFRNNWRVAWIIMLSTMLVDLDHLLANPVFMANRCSINFHPLHSYAAICVYVVMLLFKKVRIIGIGLILHMVADYLDCLWMSS